MMKIYLKKIYIKNFRCFNNQGIEVIFNKGVNAIIGENNSGKSALVDAIRIAFSTVPYSKDIYFTKSDFYTNNKGDRATTAQFDIYLEEVPTFLIDIWNPESPTTGEFHLRFYTAMTPGGIEKVKYKAWGGKMEGNPLSPETFDAMNIAFLGALRDAENEMRPSRSSKLANLLSTITTDEAAKTELVDELLKANKAILSKESIKKTKEIINLNLLEIEQEMLHQQVDIGLVDPKFESIASSLRSWIVPRWFFVGDDYPHYATLREICTVQSLSKLVRNTDGGIYLDINSFLHSGADISEEISSSLMSLMRYSFELHQNGLGYNNLLFMSAVLGDMSLNKSGIHLNLFTIEEPEAHLHPQLQELIHSFFERKHRNSSSSIQVIYTSHSPTLVSRIGINSINLLFEDTYTIQCYPLSRANLDETDQGYLEKYLDVTKSQMFFAKGILFVEGICEAILLPEMAKILGRPFDKFAVEMVNVDGTSFRPFAKILSLPAGGKCFAKAAILTDDDRCADKDDPNTYIVKDLDFDDDLTGIYEKIQSGIPSARFENISELCKGINVELCGATKTLEFELALHPNNVHYLLDAINSEFPQVGVKLKELVNAETMLENKALRIWLFIRARNSSKGQVAQSLSRALQKQIENVQNGIDIENPFIVPPYITKAIYAVTEPEG
jgi:putative ATP-dependent endonuclease of the OLD family